MKCAAGAWLPVLEGGYHLDVLAHSVLTTLRELSGCGEGPSDPFGMPRFGAERDVAELLSRLIRLHNIADPPHYSLP